MRPRLLDLFSCQGGAGEGYHRAGFDVEGVDKILQPRYPHVFRLADALEYAERHGWTYDAIHASPPCQAFSLATGYHPGARDAHEDLIGPTRVLLDRIGLPYVIENVPGAPIRKDVLLCGEMFGLGVHRHRYFETSGFFVMQPRHSPHTMPGAPTNSAQPEGTARLVAGHFADVDGAAKAMGIDWMDRKGLAQAIPPAYTEHIGIYLLASLNAKAVA